MSTVLDIVNSPVVAAFAGSAVTGLWMHIQHTKFYQQLSQHLLVHARNASLAVDLVKGMTDLVTAAVTGRLGKNSGTLIADASTIASDVTVEAAPPPPPAPVSQTTEVPHA